MDSYCKPTNMQVERNETNLMAPYDPNTPIATLFERFEECREVARASTMPYTEKQLVQKLITLLEKTGVYNEQVEEWEDRPPGEKSWKNAEVFWLQKHLARRNRPTATMQGAGYHQNPFAHLAEHDDNSTESTDTQGTAIVEGFAAMARERDADKQLIDQLTARLAALENAAFAAGQLGAPAQRGAATRTRQQQTPQPPPQQYTPQPPPQPPHPPVGYQTPWQPQGQWQRRATAITGGGGRRSRRQRRQQRRVVQQQGQHAYQQHGGAQQFPQGCTIITQQGHAGQYASTPNPRKYHDNDWFCWSCGYDVDHPGSQCPRMRQGHQPTATRYNLRQFVQVGRWCCKGQYRNIMPNGQILNWDRVEPVL